MIMLHVALLAAAESDSPVASCCNQSLRIIARFSKFTSLCVLKISYSDKYRSKISKADPTPSSLSCPRLNLAQLVLDHVAQIF